MRKSLLPLFPSPENVRFFGRKKGGWRTGYLPASGTDPVRYCGDNVRDILVIGTCDKEDRQTVCLGTKQRSRCQNDDPRRQAHVAPTSAIHHHRCSDILSLSHGPLPLASTHLHRGLLCRSLATIECHGRSFTCVARPASPFSSIREATSSNWCPANTTSSRLRPRSTAEFDFARPLGAISFAESDSNAQYGTTTQYVAFVAR